MLNVGMLSVLMRRTFCIKLVCFVCAEKFHRGCKYTPGLKDASLFQKKFNIPKWQVLGGFSFQRTISHEKNESYF
jgi:hypothetical protein